MIDACVSAATMISPIIARVQGSRTAEVSPEQLAELQIDCDSRLIAMAHNRLAVCIEVFCCWRVAAAASRFCRAM